MQRNHMQRQPGDLVLPVMLKNFLILLAAQLFCAAQLWPAGPNSLSQEEAEAGWLLLFDGKTTKGWTGLYGNPFPEGHWVVEDNCLKTAPGSYRGDIITEELFDDFEFSCEWKVPPGGNSGVKYELLNYAGGIPALFRNSLLEMAVALLVAWFLVRSMRRRGGRPNGKRLKRTAVIVVLLAILSWIADDTNRSYEYLHTKALGFEMQVLDNSGHADGRIPAHQAGALYDLIVPARDMAKPPGEFNQARILVRGTHGEQWLNGVKVVEFEMESPDLVERIAASKFNTLDGFGSKRSTPIALQNHGQEVCFRNLKIRPL